MTTLGRPESFRIAYQAVLHDLAQVTAERDVLKERLAWSEANALKWEQDTRESAKVCVDVTKRMTAERDASAARADAAEAEVTRLRAFVAEHGITAAHSGYQKCLGCGSFGYFPDNDSSRHESGCIVAEARQQKEAKQ